MKELKSVTLLKRRNIIIISVIIVAICSLIAVWFYFNNYSKRYIKPPVEISAVEGKAEIDEIYGYSEMKASEEFAVGVCGAPYANLDGVDLYFTNPEGNNVLLKCVLLDSSENVIGESGTITPNSYVKTIKFDKQLESGTHDLTIKVLAYEPDTYYSKGVIYLKTTFSI